jgi:hypothetical protein
MAIALDRPTLLTPGLKPADPRFESWWVRPGGATVVRVRPGDRLTVRDPDGGQPAEVTVLDAEGGEDAAALGARADAPATDSSGSWRASSGATGAGTSSSSGRRRSSDGTVAAGGCSGAGGRAAGWAVRASAPRSAL